MAKEVEKMITADRKALYLSVGLLQSTCGKFDLTNIKTDTVANYSGSLVGRANLCNQPQPNMHSTSKIALVTTFVYLAYTQV